MYLYQRSGELVGKWLESDDVKWNEMYMGYLDQRIHFVHCKWTVVPVMLVQYLDMHVGILTILHQNSPLSDIIKNNQAIF